MKTLINQQWNKWQLAPDSDPQQRFIIVDEHNKEVCSIVRDEQTANLIAQAPALFRIAQRVYELVESGDWSLPLGYHESEINELISTLNQVDGNNRPNPVTA